MKKIFAILTLSILLGFILLPVVANATTYGPGVANQKRPNECCKLKHNIKIGNTKITAGKVVGVSGGYCKIAGVTQTINVTDPAWAAFCLTDSIITITNWIFWAVFLISAAVIVYSGFLYMTAAGNPDKASKAKSALTYAVIGVIIALFARLIPALVTGILGL